MRSKWFHLKSKAQGFRKKGLSIKKIERLLGIPRSTLSGWFRNIYLTSKQSAILMQKKKDALVKARKKQ